MTAKKTSSAKSSSDKLTVNDNLEALAAEIATDFDPYAFSFKGKRFVTLNPYDLDLGEVIDVDMNDVRGALKQFLGDQFDDFMDLKPSMKHGIALVQKAQEFYEARFGNPGESGGSQTS